MVFGDRRTASTAPLHPPRGTEEKAQAIKLLLQLL